VLSEELEERIDTALGFPTHDPHGDPIPDANLKWPAAQRPVRDGGPGEGVRGNREVSPATTRSDRKTSVPKASTARRG
jgi:hypothetical protein